MTLSAVPIDTVSSFQPPSLPETKPVCQSKTTTNNCTTTHIFHRSFAQPLKLANRLEGHIFTMADGHNVLNACGDATVACIGQGDEEIIAAPCGSDAKDLIHLSSSYTTWAAENLARDFLDGNSLDLQKCCWLAVVSTWTRLHFQLHQNPFQTPVFWAFNQGDHLHYLAPERELVHGIGTRYVIRNSVYQICVM